MPPENRFERKLKNANDGNLSAIHVGRFHRIGYLPDQAKTVLEEYWKFSKKIVAVQVQHF